PAVCGIGRHRAVGRQDLGGGAARRPGIVTARPTGALGGRRSLDGRSIVSNDHTEPIWRPSDARIAATAMRRFIDRHRSRLDGDGYAALYRWSVEEPEAFWPAVAEFANMRFESPPVRVLDGRGRMPGARWFDGATL